MFIGGSVLLDGWGEPIVLQLSPVLFNYWSDAALQPVLYMHFKNRKKFLKQLFHTWWRKSKCRNKQMRREMPDYEMQIWKGRKAGNLNMEKLNETERL